MSSEYIYNGEKFIVTKPDACQMRVSAKGLTATISINTSTRRYRESLQGWGTDQPTLDRALNSACRRILKNSRRPSPKELCSDMDKFYKSLSEE